MDFIKHISHSLFFATGAGARKLRQMRWIAVCALLAAAAAGLAQSNQFWPRRAQAEPAAALHGESAVRRLKADGGYASLSAALAAARYRINAAPAQSTQSGQSGAPFYANNPGQQLRATFASDEVRVNTASKKPDGKTSGKTEGAELRLRLAGYGYGDKLTAVTPGTLTAHGDRITIRKSSILNPQSSIEEWYVNKPEGLEQGFTLAAPPARGRPGEWLRVALSVGEGWRASIRGDQQGAFFERQTDGLRLGYDHLLAYDAQGRRLPARMALEGGALALLVDDAQAVYPLTIDPILTQQRKLTAADAAAGDQFGSSVALSGDTAVIGAQLDDVTGGDQGSAYVFVCPACPTVTLNPDSLPGGVIGNLYSHAVTASGGAGPYQFSLSEGALPGGLTLTPGGLLSGAPTAFGVFNFTARTTDANGCQGTRAYTLTVGSSACNFSVAPANHAFPSGGGSGLAKSTEAATTQPLPATLAGTRVSVLDSLGTERFAPLIFVSPTQINFQVPPGTAVGKALVTIIHDDETVAADSPQMEMVSPGLFSANASGQGLMIGVALRMKADGSQSFEPVVRFDEEKQQLVAAPIDLDSATDRVFLVLFATGLRYRSSLGAVSVKIGGVNADVIYAGPQGSFVGLDQLNVSLSRSLAGRGEVELNVLVDGQGANKLKVAIK